MPEQGIKPTKGEQVNEVVFPIKSEYCPSP